MTVIVAQSILSVSIAILDRSEVFILSDFNIDLGYGWWFTVTYVLITISMIAIYGKGFSRRFFSLATSKSIKQKIPVVLGAALFGRALML